MGPSPTGFDSADMAKLKSLRSSLDSGTKFIPNWVKVSVALALGLGTMVGWKRIVVTVGEKIGKTHLTYAQGASAEIVAMARWSGGRLRSAGVNDPCAVERVAGTMAANGSRLRWSTIKNMALAWVLTWPAAMVIAGSLYVILRQVF